MTAADVVALVLAGSSALGAVGVATYAVLRRSAAAPVEDTPSSPDGSTSTARPSAFAPPTSPRNAPAAGATPRRPLPPPRRQQGPPPDVQRDWPPKPPTLPQRARTDAVSVLLIDRRDGTARWRVASTTDAECTTVDVFSFRPDGKFAAHGWRHELLDGALVLGAHDTAEIVGPPPNQRYVVSISWTVAFAGGDYRERRLLTVEPTSN